MDRNPKRLLLHGGCTTLFLLLIACNLSQPTPPVSEPAVLPGTEPPAVEAPTSGPAQATFDYEAGIGSILLWVDQAYVVFVPPGDFWMGQDEQTLATDYEPAHTVSLDGFWIHQTEVTNRQYAACVAAGECTVPYQESGKPDWYANPAHGSDPVVGVSWNQAGEYCSWIEGRLPTEAEWEKAARGMEGEPYPWGGTEPGCDLLNYAGCQEIDQPVRVRSFPDGASPYLLADTAGNVAEWVQDWYEQAYYATSPTSNPPGPSSGTRRVVRGSNYDSLYESLGIYLRGSALPTEHQAEIGFRCVLTGETVGNPPPPLCELPPFLPGPVGDHPIDLYPPEFAMSSFCMTDTDGNSQPYVTLVSPDVVTPGDYTFDTSSYLGLVILYPDDHTVSISGPGVPLDTPFDVTVCQADAPLLPDLIPECPDGYYLDETAGLCRYGDASIHGSPDTCTEGELYIPGYGCQHACEEPYLLCGCPVGYDFYHDYTPGDPTGTYTVCVPPDGPEDCLTDPNCSAWNTCLSGLSYDGSADCCTAPPNLLPACPAPWVLSLSDFPHCKPPVLAPLCTSWTLSIPSCDTPPQQLICANPSSYTSPSTCAAAACRWVYTMAQPVGYCTYP